MTDTTQVAKTDEEFLREVAERIRVRVSHNIFETGRDLIAVKERVGHGNFLRWLDEDAEISEPTATRMMNVVRVFGDGQIFQLKGLMKSTLYELAAPSTPPEVRDKLGPRLIAGERITVADVQALKEKTRDRALLVEHGIPALVEAVDRGEVSISAAVAFVKTNPPKAQDEKIIKAGRDVAEAVKRDEAAKAKAKAGKRPKEETPNLFDAPKRPTPDVETTATLIEVQADRASERRMFSEGVMRVLDLFERDGIDPRDRAATIVEQFNPSIAEANGGKVSAARVRRAGEAIRIVFAEITADLECDETDDPSLNNEDDDNRPFDDDDDPRWLKVR